MNVETYRNDKWGFDGYKFPNGILLQVYDDGHMKVGGINYRVEARTENFSKSPKSNAHGHALIYFASIEEGTE